MEDRLTMLILLDRLVDVLEGAGDGEDLAINGRIAKLLVRDLRVPDFESHGYTDWNRAERRLEQLYQEARAANIQLENRF